MLRPLSAASPPGAIFPGLLFTSNFNPRPKSDIGKISFSCAQYLCSKIYFIRRQVLLHSLSAIHYSTCHVTLVVQAFFMFLGSQRTECLGNRQRDRETASFTYKNTIVIIPTILIIISIITIIVINVVIITIVVFTIITILIITVIIIIIIITRIIIVLSLSFP